MLMDPSPSLMHLCRPPKPGRVVAWRVASRHNERADVLQMLTAPSKETRDTDATPHSSRNPTLAEPDPLLSVHVDVSRWFVMSSR